MLRTLRGVTSTHYRSNTLLSSLPLRTTATTIGMSTSRIETDTFEDVSKKPISSCPDSGQPASTNDIKKKRQLQRNYVYFLNQRGQLFHIFDVEGFINRRTTPSGPTFLRETRFLDFFFKRLSPNVYFMKNEEEGCVHPCGPSVSSSSNSSSSSSSDNGITTSITTITSSVPQLSGRKERYAAALQGLLLRQELEPSGLWEDFNNNLQAAKTRQRQQLHTAKGIEREIDDDDERHPDDILIRTLRHRFPWVSHCGHEKNFLIAEDSPIVFHDLQWCCSPSSSQQQQRGDNDHEAGNNNNNSSIAVTKEEAANMMMLQSSTTHAQLLFAGGFREPFRPSALRCSRDGRLYHPVTVASHFMFHRAWDPAAALNDVPAAAPSATSSHGGGGGLLARVKRVLFSSADGLPPTTAVSSPLLGLVGAQVGLRLGLDFVCEDQSADGNFEIEWLGTKHIIPFLDEVRQ